MTPHLTLSLNDIKNKYSDTYMISHVILYRDLPHRTPIHIIWIIPASQDNARDVMTAQDTQGCCEMTPLDLSLEFHS